MFPPIDPLTGYLPPGVHQATWQEVQLHFSGNEQRRRLMSGLGAALENLSTAGCRTVLLDGSFISQKELPSDYDGAWDTTGVNPDLLDPVLLDFTNQRAAMKFKRAANEKILMNSKSAEEVKLLLLQKELEIKV